MRWLRPLLLAVTRFRLAPLLQDDTRAAGESFHDTVNRLAVEPRGHHTMDEHRHYQERLEALVRRDLGR